MAPLLRALLAVGGKGNCGAAIGMVGVRRWRTVHRATDGMCKVKDKSGSYHARALVTLCGLQR